MSEQHKTGRAKDESDRENHVEDLLQKISAQIDQAQREKRQEDFSMVRLGGSLLQMLAIVAALWGVVSLLSEHTAQATPRLTLACFLQLAALTAAVIDRWR